MTISGGPLTGALIAGGASIRFGSAKEKLPRAGSSLGNYLLGQMQSAGLQPLIYNAAKSLDGLPPGVRWMPDREPGHGPLGGLATVLSASQGPVLIAACDMPGLTVEAFQALMGAWRPGLRGLVAHGDDGWHPMFGIYDPAILGAIEQRLATGQNAMHRLIEDLKLSAWTPKAGWLVNINTPLDWDLWSSKNQRPPPS